MTLKEKFDNPIMRHDLGRNEIEETKEQCVEIADDFAIGFVKWYWLKCIISNFDRHLSVEQSLEIYKKEKGL